MSRKVGFLGGLLAGWLLLAPPAMSGVVVETEPNDTLASAQFITNGSVSFRIDGERTFDNPSDDFFAFEVRSGGLLSIRSSSPDAFADSIMGLFDPLGNLVASSDDNGVDFMSAIDFTVDAAQVGIWRLALSGFNPLLLSCTATVTECYDTDGDFRFDTFVSGGGSGGSTGWAYSIDLRGDALVPAPGSMALVALALPIAGWARRRSRR